MPLSNVLLRLTIVGRRAAALPIWGPTLAHRPHNARSRPRKKILIQDQRRGIGQAGLDFFDPRIPSASLVNEESTIRYSLQTAEGLAHAGFPSDIAADPFENEKRSCRSMSYSIRLPGEERADAGNNAIHLSVGHAGENR